MDAQLETSIQQFPGSGPVGLAALFEDHLLTLVAETAYEGAKLYKVACELGAVSGLSSCGDALKLDLALDGLTYEPPQEGGD